MYQNAISPKLLRLALYLAWCCVITAPANTPSWASGDEYYQMDDNALLHFQQGQIWMESGSIPAAIREYQVAIQLKPSATLTASVYNNLGIAYTRIKQYPKAIVSYQKAIELNPNFSLYYENLVQTYIKAKSGPQAIRKLEHIVQGNPSNRQAWYILGLLYQKSLQKELARGALETAYQLAPDTDLAQAIEQHLSTLQSSQSPMEPLK